MTNPGVPWPIHNPPFFCCKKVEAGFGFCQALEWPHRNELPSGDWLTPMTRLSLSRVCSWHHVWLHTWLVWLVTFVQNNRTNLSMTLFSQRIACLQFKLFHTTNLPCCAVTTKPSVGSYLKQCPPLRTCSVLQTTCLCLVQYGIPSILIEGQILFCVPGFAPHC